MAVIGPAHFLLHDDVVGAFGRELIEREVVGRYTAAGECPICQVPLAPSVRDGARTLTVATTVPAETGSPFAGVVALYAAHLECAPNRGFLSFGASLIAPSTYQYFGVAMPVADAPNALVIVVNPSVDQVHLTRMSVNDEWKVLGSIHGLGDPSEGWFKMTGGTVLPDMPKMVGTFDITTGHVRLNGGYTLDVEATEWPADLQIATVLVSERLAIPSGASRQGLLAALEDFMKYGHAGQLEIVGRAPAAPVGTPAPDPGVRADAAPRRRWWRRGGERR
ncbi:hypothetical protein AXK56_16730 [Tsukamurella pulmonis]|uniref:Uncharacterized protein n=1 Tax=Tsukamurella pulmonis TaxID=47312 RepID=A0A1H1ACC7_9ACTN|nr:hypothetical protein [Tsukamurella pulmonis]KXO95855.1 hypothetical protein AXK56_16730 [Tsukamurella pulmonis]SDQ37297.1 hypothetical protein SAMN04489765_0156 [Tsukamurella pulmonis]SUQ39380.1 Uncharacterised protein [Tsukamurella pulmonis]